MNGITGCADWLLAAALAVVVFSLASYKLTDTDLWWHLRAGEWIIASRGAPGLDPFSFGSSDRLWIDLHWLFEIIVSGAFRAGGVAGVTALAATIAAAATFLAIAGSSRFRPTPIVLVCWIAPATLFGYRLDPRPELFSVLFLAAFLVVLDLSSRRPAWVWVLPGVQVLWVNMQGLFILGPLVFALFLISRSATRWGLASNDSRPHGSETPTQPRKLCRNPHVLAFATVLIACLANPYGLKGALFPLELFPKISDPANDYKTYIDEFFSPFDYARRSQAFVHSHSLYYRALYLLWLALPLSFAVPAISRAASAAAARSRSGPPHQRLRHFQKRGDALAIIAVVVGLAGGAYAAIDFAPIPWHSYLGWGAAAVSAACWILSASAIRRLSASASALAILAGAGQMLTMIYFQSAFAGKGDFAAQSPGMELLLIACWGAAALLAMRAGADAFRMLIAAAFAYLSFQAMRNLNLFALTAGVILTWNVTEWAGRDSDLGRFTQGSRPAAWLARGVLATFVAGWLFLISTGAWNERFNPGRQFGFGEPEGEFAHAAAQFAGGDGLPDRAIAFDLGMSSLYVFHNGPEKKIYMDPRLEVPALDTFRNYVEIDDSLHGRGDAWRASIQRLGAPLVLLDHRSHGLGEALLLTEGNWRCIYFDSLASVFVSQQSDVSQRKYPAVDFSLRHFSSGREAKLLGAQASRLESEALIRLGSELCPRPSATWPWRVPAQWLALDRLSVASQPAPSADDWALRGRCYWNMVPSFAVRPPGPTDAWDNGAGMRWAQATWCFQQALRLEPRHATSWRNLYDAWRARRMHDAQRTAGRQLTALGAAGSRQMQEIAKLEPALRPLDGLEMEKQDATEKLVTELVARGLSATAAEWVLRNKAAVDDWNWQIVDRLAAAWMHLGRPELARTLWQSATSFQSRAERLSRLGDTWWVEGELKKAEQYYRRALDADPRNASSLWALAMLHAEQGKPAETRSACVEALQSDLPNPRREELRAILSIVPSPENSTPADSAVRHKTERP